MGRSVSMPSGCTEVCFQTLSDDDAFGDDWEDFLDDITTRCIETWPSMYVADEWVGREDHAIVQNAHVWIGVSEYCGLVAIWLKVKDEENGLSVQWAKRIAPKFAKMFGQLRQIGHMSNGEAVYRKIEQ